MMKTTTFAASLLAVTATLSHADEIRVLNWQGYGTDIDWSLAAFEEATGHKVLHEYFNSEQEMLTKLRTNPGAYDVVMINAIFVPQAIDEGLIAPVETSRIENYADIREQFAKDEMLNRDGKVYGVPWTWGLTSFAINTQSYETAPDSIQAFWDADHAGRVAIRDDPIEAVQLGALATGQGINEINDLDAVRAKLAELMPQLRTYWSSENDWNQFMAAGELDIATYWSGSASRSAAMGLPVQFIIPKEGAVGWLDSLTIPESSTQKEAAAQFIDWMIDPEFYAKWDPEGAPASASEAAINALPEDAFNRQVLGDSAVVERVQFQKTISDEDRKAYLELWQSLKAEQ